MLDFLTKIGSFTETYAEPLQHLTNLSDLISGNRQMQAGAEMSAQGFRQAASSSIAAAEYNNAVDAIDTQRRVEAMSRQLDRLAGQNRVIAASSGFSAGSRSFLAVMDANLDLAARQMSQERTALSHRQQADLFEARSRQVALEGQARMAEWQAEQQSKKNFGGILSGIGGLASSLGDIFGG